MENTENLTDVTYAKKFKKRLIGNVIKFIIGICLLVLCWVYVEKHPAEKISFFSGFKVIFQNVEIAIFNLVGQDGALLRQKYNLQNYYEVLIALSDEKPCIDPDIRLHLHKTYDDLVHESFTTLAQTIDEYIEKQVVFDRELRVECEVEEVQGNIGIDF